MSTEEELFAKRQSLGEQTLSITVEQYLDFIIAHKSDGPCESCGQKNWSYAQDDDGPAIMGTANVRNPNTANWFFYMTCMTCANTRLIEAGRVWDYCFEPKGDSADGQ